MWYYLLNENGTVKTATDVKPNNGVKYTAETPPIDFIKPAYDGEAWFDAYEINEEDEFKNYLKRKKDGEIAYLKLSARFRTLKEKGFISEVTHNGIESLLTPIRNEIMFGQWKKGLEILESIGAILVGQELYDELHFIISDYISKNY